MAGRKRRRTEQLLALETFRRKLPHVSQSSLCAILQEVQRSGVPELHGRKHMLQARDLLTSACTPYGRVREECTIPSAAPGGEGLVFPYTNLLALIYTAYAQCEPFATFLDERLEAVPSTFENPWHLVAYCDEVQPGDPIGGKMARKLQAVYASFLEFGAHALSHEACWFTVATIRSRYVAHMAGGMAAVFGRIIKQLFVEGPLPDVGLELRRTGKPAVSLFSVLGCFCRTWVA